eukprot:TRINITY_DN70804_c1_g1_i1.p1 TRINITY_DN70804_c1_g1~~TRINITY_DN70804_c1_g1_i1.p1  ORF type:complete len:673 (-),score=67.41 TRINITY_DN70804_c1_g1_i1:111-2129(-)
MCAFVFGATYAYSWMVPALACFLGAVFHLVINHLYKIPIYEMAYFDIMYAVAYGVLATYFYASEYQNRYDFYLVYQHEIFQRSYKKLLKNLPIGLVLLDKENYPVLYNRAIARIVSKKLERSSGSSQNNALEELPNVKTQIMSVMKDFVQKNSNITLKEVVEGWRGGQLQENKVYLHKTEEGEFTYTVKGLKAMFGTEKHRALVLQDQTAFENLAKLDEKYQKLYVASIAHDIRTPLNGIVGMLDMLDSRQWNAEETLYLSIARRTCKLLLYLTYSITDYSLLESNKFKACNTVTNIRETLYEVKELFSFSFDKKRLENSFACSEQVPIQLFIDKDRYMQILITLLGNALKFTFEGYVRVYVDYTEHNDFLITSVKDTGTGIKPEEIPRLFKLFGKLENPTEHYPQGIGFGLTICKKLSESLGGYISVFSQEGAGSTFTFAIRGNLRELEEKLPRVDSESPVMSEYLDTSFNMLPEEIHTRVKGHDFPSTSRLHTVDTSSREPILRKPVFDSPKEETKGVEQKACTCRNLLIVDDNEYNLFVLQGYLKSVGHVADQVFLFKRETKQALNGAEAIEKIADKAQNTCGCAKAYKLVVMDINMPVLDGIEATRILREKMQNGEIPPTTIIALSAQPLREEDKDFYESEVGFSTYITKPTTKQDFLSIVRRYGAIQ